MAKEKEYYLYVSGVSVKVPQEVYLTYYKMARHEKYLAEQNKAHRVELYSNLDTDEILGEEMIPDDITPSVDETALTNVLREKLRQSIAQLSEPEQELIYAIYFEGLSERQLSERTGYAQRTINDRKRKILAKLKKLMKY